MKEVQLYRSKLTAIARLLRAPAMFGVIVSLVSWRHAGISHSTLSHGILTFLITAILSFALSLRRAYKFEFNDNNTLRGFSIWGVAECPLNEIHNLKIVKSLNGEVEREYGLVEHSLGEIYTIMLNEAQSLKLQRFFVSIAALDSRIKLHLP